MFDIIKGVIEFCIKDACVIPIRLKKSNKLVQMSHRLGYPNLFIYFKSYNVTMPVS
jgi:hypothetical protein